MSLQIEAAISFIIFGSMFVICYREVTLVAFAGQSE